MARRDHPSRAALPTNGASRSPTAPELLASVLLALLALPSTMVFFATVTFTDVANLVVSVGVAAVVFAWAARRCWRFARAVTLERIVTG